MANGTETRNDMPLRPGLPSSRCFLGCDGYRKIVNRSCFWERAGLGRCGCARGKRSSGGCDAVRHSLDRAGVFECGLAEFLVGVADLGGGVITAVLGAMGWMLTRRRMGWWETGRRGGEVGGSAVLNSS